jgi:hypothetical protein
MVEQSPVSRFFSMANEVNEEPLIAGKSSGEHCFLLTKSYFIFQRAGKSVQLRLRHIASAKVPSDMMQVPRLKIDGGALQVGLIDGRSFRVVVKPGGAYIGLLNVLQRVAHVNRKRSPNVLAGGVDPARPTTDDQRPTTAP